MDKAKALSQIGKEIENCKICPINKIGKPVPGEGSPDAKVLFVGEAPGKTEAKTGRPFVGRSGKLLRKTMSEIGLTEKDIYITSPVKYLPIYGTPKKSDIEHGKIHLLKQIAVIRPKLIVLLGATAAKALIDRPISTLKEHGSTIKTREDTYFLTIHPAAALRFPKFREILTDDFKKLKSILPHTRRV